MPLSLYDQHVTAAAAAAYLHAHPAFAAAGGCDISREALAHVLDIAFFASLKYEERERTVFDMALFAADDPLDPGAGARASWRLHRLASPQPCEVGVVVRLARASSQGESAIAVQVDGGGSPSVIGILDLGSSHDASLTYASRERPSRPGVLQLSARAPGNLSFTTGHIQLAELRDGLITTELPDIAFDGIVGERLAGPALQQMLDAVHAQIEPAWQQAYERARDSWIVPLWRSVVYRLVIQMRRFGTGGSLLVVHEPPNVEDITLYPLEYATLREAIEALAHALVGLEAVELGICHDRWMWESRARAAGRQISDAVSFIAHLTRLDGVTVLDASYNVVGLGGTIRQIEDVPTRRVLDAHGERSAPFDHRLYGTRHRSVMSYCYGNPGAKGFIVSQDGDLRAAIRVDDELYLWDGFSAENLTWLPAD